MRTWFDDFYFQLPTSLTGHLKDKNQKLSKRSDWLISEFLISTFKNAITSNILSYINKIQNNLHQTVTKPIC